MKSAPDKIIHVDGCKATHNTYHTLAILELIGKGKRSKAEEGQRRELGKIVKACSGCKARFHQVFTQVRNARESTRAIEESDSESAAAAFLRLS